MLDLEAIEERYRRALDAKPGKGPITDIDALTDSVCDVPELLKEVERLRHELSLFDFDFSSWPN